MKMDQSSAEGDLAFMRAIVEESGTYDRSFGINYFAAGLLYGLQCFANGILLLGSIEAPSWVWLMIGVLPTVLFLSVNILTIWINRDHPFGTSTAKRAIGAAFAGSGIAILILAGVFGLVAFQRGDWTIWFLFPIVVCALQGAIWFAAAIIRRKLWFGMTAFGWFASTLLLLAFIEQAAAYVTIMGLVLILLMAGPGYIMLRHQTPQS